MAKVKCIAYLTIERDGDQNQRQAMNILFSPCAEVVLFPRQVLMLKPQVINRKEVLLIAEIIRNETWLLGERVGHAVDSKCEEVVSKVVEIVLEYAAEWRARFERGDKRTIFAPEIVRETSH